MKRRILLILFLLPLIFSACTPKKSTMIYNAYDKDQIGGKSNTESASGDESANQIASVSDSDGQSGKTSGNENYIETIPKEARFWVENAGASLLMTAGEIQAYNKKLIKENGCLVDLLSYGEKYKKGIVVNRCLLLRKALSSYTWEDVETGLYTGMPVIILEETKDWYKIQCYFYYGWTKKTNIALAGNEEWKSFCYAKDFVVITDALLKADGKLLDMGTPLPLLGVKNDKYSVLAPQRDKNGNFYTSEILIKRSQAHVGFLPYNERNVYIQSFKYLGIPYGWGDKDNGVDCSSYIANVHRVFGLFIPRNGAQQRNAFGNNTDIFDLSAEEKTEYLFSVKNLSILYRDGHTMIYLGVKDDKHYIIHASGGTIRKVVAEPIANIAVLKSVSYIV